MHAAGPGFYSLTCDISKQCAVLVTDGSKRNLKRLARRVYYYGEVEGIELVRRNFRNTGGVAEKMVLQTAAEYERCGILTLRKVDPPLRTWGPGKTILLPNHWLDFAGAWTERGGRLLLVEVKSTRERRLRIGVGGLNERQIESARLWTQAGAAVLLLWDCAGEWFAGRLPDLIDTSTGAALRAPDDLTRVEQGIGLILVDFADSLRTFWPEKQA